MQTTSKSTNNRKWFALIRLLCYGWALVVLYLLSHYEPGYHDYIQAGINTLYVAFGVCFGRNGYLFTRINTEKGGKYNAR